MRFGGIERLYGKEGFSKIQAAHVAIVGLGGVGSWAVEALARSGVGALTLIDLDDVCVTNTNRQIHALTETIGQGKASVLASRIAQINPECGVTIREQFFNKQTADEILETPFNLIIDAIDSVRDKCLLVHQSLRRTFPLVISGGVGGKRDPSRVRIADLGSATNDPLLKRLRKKLRQDHGFSRDLKVPFGFQAVFSEENPVFPWSDGRVCSEPEPGRSLTLDCATGFGTASFLTGAIGFACAAEAVRQLVTGIES